MTSSALLPSGMVMDNIVHAVYYIIHSIVYEKSQFNSLMLTLTPISPRFLLGTG